MATFSTEGIVLAHAAQGETDRMIHLYTRLHGMLSIRVRGARKIGSKLSGSAEPFTDGLFFLAHGSGGYTLTGVEPANAYPLLKQRVTSVGVASLAAEAVITLTRPMHPDRAVYDLMIDLLRALDVRTASVTRLRLLAAWTIVRLLTATGSGVQVDACIRCGRAQVSPPVVISPALGGLVCHRCGSAPVGSVSVSASAVKLIRVLGSLDAIHAFRIKVAKVGLDEASSALREVYAYHRDAPSPALYFLASLGV